MRETTTTRQAAAARTRLPVPVYLLGFSLFAMGSAEFLVAGVLPAVARDFGVPLSSAGTVISAFAIGVVLGGPPLAVLTLRWPRRTTLVTMQAVFAGAVAVGLFGSFGVLLATRFISGLAYAGYFAIAAVTAISLAPPARKARACGVVVSGLTLAMVVGGPASALLSHFTGWRGGFGAVIALTALGAILTAVVVPATSMETEPSVRRELRSMRQPRLWAIFAATLLTTGAYMVSYNYLAAFLQNITGLPSVWVPAVLTLFGIGAFLGISLGGRIADRRPTEALLAGTVGIAALSVLLALLAGQVPAVVPLVFLLGTAGFVLNPAIYGGVFTIAAHAPTLAGSMTVSAFQLGISLVPVFAGAALNAGASTAAIPWVGAALALVAIPPSSVTERSPVAVPKTTTPTASTASTPVPEHEQTLPATKDSNVST